MKKIAQGRARREERQREASERQLASTQKNLKLAESLLAKYQKRAEADSRLNEEVAKQAKYVQHMRDRLTEDQQRYDALHASYR